MVVLYWYDKDYPWNIMFDTAFQQKLRSNPSVPVEYHAEYLETNRFPKEEAAALLHDYLQRKYAERKVDAVVATSDVPLDFLTSYRADLFRESPLVFVATKHPDAHILNAGPGATGIISINAYRKTLDLALKLHPEIEQVFIISGTLEHDKRIENLARADLEGYETKVKVNYLTDVNPNELVTTARTLPAKSVILYVWQQSQRTNGKVIESMDILGSIAQSAQVPIYRLSTASYAGSGVVGGYLNTAEANGTKVAEIVLQILNGTPASQIGIDSAPTVAEFDWRELRRFGISESQLPTGSVIRFKQITFWSQYKGRILAVLTIIFLESLLIAGLLLERNRKKRATTRLSESEERFAKAFKANPQPMSLTTLADGRYIDVNESFLQMSGYTRDEVIGRSSVELGVFESAAQRNKVVVEPLLKSGVRNVEMRFRTKDGSARTLLSSFELLELSGKKCVLVASSDITDRKTLEQELQRSEREFSTLVENSPDVITRLDRNLRFVYVSPTLRVAAGINRDEVIGKMPHEVPRFARNAGVFEGACQEAFATGKIVVREFADDSRHYRTRIIPEVPHNGKVEHVMAIAEDVTERLHSQQELLKLTSRLFTLQDEERRHMARELHDGAAQNIFAIVISLENLGRQLTEASPETKRLHQECISLSEDTLQELRTLSYLFHPPILDECGLPLALQWYVEGFAKRSGIQVDLIMLEDIGRLPSDIETALFRIVQESLTNIRRHSGSESAVIRLEKRPSGVALEISDHGCGLSGNGRPHLDDQTTELGVGIPGMRQRLAQLGGRLEIESSNEGTTIVAFVPDQKRSS